jgi:hypothetical protein
MKVTRIILLLLILPSAACARRAVDAPIEETTVTVDWNHVIRVSNTNATLQVVVTPLMGPNSPIHDQVFRALQDLRCDYIRYVPWLPYPKLAVAELEPPANGKTSWDFSLIDPFAIDFAQASQGHSTIWNFSTIPQWMFKTVKPVPYPADPNQPVWDYEQGTDLRDPSMKEVADYYARLVSWYTQGGFSDEFGKRHESGHHYKIDYWEVLNEVDLEHHMTPQFYTALYGAVVAAIRKVDPQVKFVGTALAAPSVEPQYFEYFLDHKNHKPGTPLDMISYHFYATPTPDESFDVWRYTFFVQADGFLSTVRYIQTARQRLSPETGTTVDEVGAISADDFKQGEPGHVTQPIPGSFWNLCAALYAYLYGELSRLGVEGVGESALAQLPGFYPSVTMMDWNTGEPNARYWVLKLLRDNFGPGDKLVEASVGVPYVYALGYVGAEGKHKILLVNKRNRPFEVSIPGGAGAIEDYVDQTTGNHAPASVHLTGDSVNLGGLAVAVVTLAP